MTRPFGGLQNDVGPSSENLLINRNWNLIGTADEERQAIELQFFQFLIAGGLQPDQQCGLGLERTGKTKLNDGSSVISRIAYFQGPKPHVVSRPELTRSFIALAAKRGAALQQKTLLGSRDHVGPVRNAQLPSTGQGSNSGDRPSRARFA